MGRPRLKIDKDNFVEVVSRSKTMTEACIELDLRFSTFRSYAKKFGIYKPNPGGKGLPGESPSTKIALADILAGKHPQYGTSKLRARLIAEGYKKHQCERCKLDKWFEQLITLECHHIDGNPENHRLENLQLLCPNCHNQTSNYGSKNKFGPVMKR